MSRRKLAGVLVLALGGLWLVKSALWAWPPSRQKLTLWDQRRARFGLDPGILVGPLGLARHSQLVSPELGPLLLSDASLVDRRVAELADTDAHGGDQEAIIKFRGEWALYYAARRLQGQSREQVLAGPQGVELALGTLAAEADPPEWWSSDGWLARAVQASPQGSFHLGLMTPQDTAPLVERAGTLSLHQLPALVDAVLRHQDGLDKEQRTAILKAWREQQKAYLSPNNLACIDRVLAQREQVIKLLADQQEVPLSLEISPGLSDKVRADYSEVALDFLRSCGYQPRPGQEEALKVEVGVDVVDFSQVATDVVKTFETTEKVKVGQSGYSKYAPGGWPIYKEQLVQHRYSQSQDGQASLVSMVMTLTQGPRCLGLTAPPYGQVYQEDLARMRQLLSQEQRESKEQFDLDWYLTATAAAPWRYGLHAYERDWKPRD